ncbi:hypothetical protein H0H93_013388, partial [Arthromyces matolae]
DMFETALKIELQTPSLRELYNSWQLFDISIRSVRGSEDYLQLDLMNALTKCVPAIRTLSRKFVDR